MEHQLIIFVSKICLMLYSAIQKIAAWRHTPPRERSSLLTTQKIPLPLNTYFEEINDNGLQSVIGCMLVKSIYH